MVQKIFPEKNLAGTRLNNCTGITAEQIGAASTVGGMFITSTQYNEWKSTLQSKFKGQSIYVDYVRTKIQ